MRKEISAHDEFLLEGIDYFRSGTKLFNLLYVLIWIQITLMLCSMLVCLIVGLLGSGMIATILMGIATAISNIKIMEH